LQASVASTVYVSESVRMVPVIVSVVVVVVAPLDVLIVALPPRLTPLTRVVPFFFHTGTNGILP